MRNTEYSFSPIYNQNDNVAGGIAILMGGLLQPQPVEYMKKIISCFVESNAIKRAYKGTGIEVQNHFVFVEEHLDNPYLWLVAWGIENDALYTTSNAEGREYQRLESADGKILIIKGGFQSDSPKAYMDLVLSHVVAHNMYNAFVECNLRNPFYRIIVFDINELPKHKYIACQAR